LMETGERERGLALIKYAWGRYTLGPAVEEKFRSRFGTLLTEDDQSRRARLLAVHAAYKNDPGKVLAANKSKKGLKGLKAAIHLNAKRAKNPSDRRGSKRAAPRRRRRGAHFDTRTPVKE